MSTRGKGFGVDEDVLLCLVYLEISQDSTTVKHQSGDQFWSRVEDAYNSKKHEGSEVRSKRSIQSRIQTIEKAVRKLNGCIRQVESMHLSGASENDIIHQAKILLKQDDNYKRGFKFDHVWDIVKNVEKFKNDVTPSRQKTLLRNLNDVSSESNNPTAESLISASLGLSAFSINLDDTFGDSASKSPMGLKNAKLKRKIDVQSSSMVDYMKEGHQAILNMLEKSDLRKQRQLDIQERNLALKELKLEDRMLERDLSAITDPEIYAYVKFEQRRIIAKRSQQHK